jgi:hypothetical protein
MEEWKILTTLSGPSHIVALSFHTTFSQTQTGATVPLRSHLVFGTPPPPRSPSQEVILYNY